MTILMIHGWSAAWQDFQQDVPLHSLPPGESGIWIPTSFRLKRLWGLKKGSTCSNVTAYSLVFKVSYSLMYDDIISR